MVPLSDLMENKLLAAWPWEERARLQTGFEAVEMPLGQALYESGDTLSHVYFPGVARSDAPDPRVDKRWTWSTITS